jgi:hypothetical protein
VAVPPFAAHAALCWGVQQKRIEDVAVASVTLPEIAAIAAKMMTPMRTFKFFIFRPSVSFYPVFFLMCSAIFVASARPTSA